MLDLRQAFTSTLGRKFQMGLSGIGLVGFMIMHLLGNITIYERTGDGLNLYAYGLKHSLGPFFYVAEAGLFGLFAYHAVTGILVTLRNKGARGQGYRSTKTKGGASQSSVASRNMAITGAVLLVFVILHIKHFRFGPAEDAGYLVNVNGVEMRDLYRLVIETFSSPLYVGWYVGVMILLAMHMRHGFWSAFQSLGLSNSRWAVPMQAIGLVLAGILSVGFLFIPVVVYLRHLGVIQ